MHGPLNVKLLNFDYCCGYLFTYIIALEGHCEITNPAVLTEAHILVDCFHRSLSSSITIINSIIHAVIKQAQCNKADEGIKQFCSYT